MDGDRGRPHVDNGAEMVARSHARIDQRDMVAMGKKVSLGHDKISQKRRETRYLACAEEMKYNEGGKRTRNAAAAARADDERRV